MITKLFTQIKKRKFTAGIVFLLIVGIGYWGFGSLFGNDGVVRYASAQVQKGTLIVSLSGTGQVSVSNQVDVKPKASGDVVYVGVKNGQEVKAGALIAQLNTKDPQRAVRNAELDLESARLDLRSSQTSQSENIEKQKVVVANAYTKLLNSTFEVVPYDFNATYTNTDPPAISGNYTLGKEGEIIIETYASQGGVSYRLSGLAGGSGMVDDTFAQPIDNTGLYIKFATNDYTQNGKTWVIRIPNKNAGDYIANLENYENAKRDLQRLENQSSTGGIALESKELNVRQKENAFLNAKENLGDYYVRAPFDGVIAQTDVKKGDPVSSASVVAMLITRQKLAEVSLNEVDVAQIKIDQKATLTFDAIPNLTITGQVAEIDTVGTVSQGVVTYNVKIAFDTQDERVKPAMSVSAAIVTEAKPNVLLVPNSAVKSQGGLSYVELVDGDDMNVALTANVSGAILKNSPRRQQVEAGTANDEFTEITSGLNEGDIIVTRTIQQNSTQPQTQQQGGLRIPGLPGGGGGGFRGGGGGGGEFAH